jgi:hypothetical protein
MLVRIRLFLFVLVAAAAVPSVVRAQTAIETPSTALAGPRRDQTATAMRQFAQQQRVALDVIQRRTRGANQSVALMIVGGAAVVLGALIGDDVGTVFMIGGAVALLIGLYQYLQ